MGRKSNVWRVSNAYIALLAIAVTCTIGAALLRDDWCGVTLGATRVTPEHSPIHIASYRSVLYDSHSFVASYAGQCDSTDTSELLGMVSTSAFAPRMSIPPAAPWIIVERQGIPFRWSTTCIAGPSKVSHTSWSGLIASFVAWSVLLVGPLATVHGWSLVLRRP